jgi:hypothetical protein
MITLGGQIAIQPFEAQPQLSGEVRGGIGRITNRFSLVSAVVVMGYIISADEQLNPGDIVYIRSDVAVMKPWSKVTYTIPESNKSFVLCPLSDVIAYSKSPTKS